MGYGEKLSSDANYGTFVGNLGMINGPDPFLVRRCVGTESEWVSATESCFNTSHWLLPSRRPSLGSPRLRAVAAQFGIKCYSY